MENEIINQRIIKYALKGTIAILLVVFVIIAIDIVPTGKTQVVTRFGKVVRTNGEGLAFHIPIVERTKSIDTTVRRERAEAVVATNNLQQVNVTAAVNYKITRDNAIKQYQNFTKKDFVSIIVQPKIQDGIKTVTPQYSAEELVLRRPEVATNIENVLRKTLSEYGIDVVDVSIENYSFSAEYAQAVASKSVIQQQTEAAKLNTEKIRIESDNNILAAEKTAEARRIQADTSRLTDRDLQYYQMQIQSKAVDKWNGVSPLYSGSNGPTLTVPIK